MSEDRTDSPRTGSSPQPRATDGPRSTSTPRDPLAPDAGLEPPADSDSGRGEDEPDGRDAGASEREGDAQDRQNREGAASPEVGGDGDDADPDAEGSEDHRDEDHRDEDHRDEDHRDEDHRDENHRDEDHRDEGGASDPGAEGRPEPAAAEGGPAPAARPPRQGFFLWLAKYYSFGVLVLLAHLVAALVVLYAHRSRRVPPTPTRTEAARSAQALTRIYAGDGRLLGELASEWRRWARYEQIPPLLVKAFVAVEDHRFFEHRGIDWEGLLRAAWINLRTGSIVQGGSTITQQLAKTYIGSQRTVDRKIREAILATRIEATMTKAEILELYLNRIFLGHGAYGISAAARRYFDKRLDQLTLPEMALIAGLARAPSRYNPFQRPARALERRNVVLARMQEQGYISRARYEAAARQGQRADGPPDLGLRRRPDFFHDGAPYFTAHVRRLLIRRFGRKRMEQGGLRVETTLNTGVHATARRHVDELARWVDKRQGWRGPVAWLGDEADRERFRTESRERYGTGTLEPGRRYLGLVERSATRAARVTVAGRAYTLPRRFLRWGARFYTRSAINDRCIRHAWLVLIPGDVVWVRLAPKDVYDPRIPGSDGQPCITSGHYQEPLHHLHDNKPPSSVEPLELPRGDGWPGPPYLALEQVPRVQGTIFSYDLRSGYVKAMVGGTDYDRSNFNRVTQACRQPGSTFKPIYYSLALHRGMSYYKKLKDKPHSIVDPQTGRIWYTYDYQHDPELRKRFAFRIDNYTKTLEQALIWSKNKASMHLFCELGPQSIKNKYARCNRAAREVKAWARRLGFSTEIIADQALGLGASCTRTDELTRAFAAFAHRGERVEPVYIRRILDRDGQVLLDRSVPWDPMLPPAARLDRLYATAGQQREQLIPPKTAYRTAKLLRKVVSRGHADTVRMTKIPAAGKTGTASRTADTWFVAHTSRWITTAWLGDDHYVRSLGRHDASFSTAQPMWARFMYDVASRHPLREIPLFDAKGRRLEQEPVIPAEQPNRHRPDYQPHFKKKRTRARPAGGPPRPSQ